MRKRIKLVTICVCVISLSISFTRSCGQSFDSIPRTNQQQGLIHSAGINEDRTVWIHLPPEYNESTDNYPVLYLLDGGSHFKYVSEMIDFLSGFESNCIPRMIVVGIPNTDRGRDFTPVLDLNERDEISKNTGAANFLNFIYKELIPYVEKTYRTQPYRILAAHSLGGLFGIYALGVYPNLFQASIIISPALIGGDEKEKVIQKFATRLKINTQLKSAFFVSVGNEDMHGADLLIQQFAKSAPATLKWNYKKYENENHFSVPYKSIYDGIRYIYSNWTMDIFLNPKKISYQDVKNHFDRLSEEFGYPIRPTEDFLNQCGYQQLRFKHVAEAIEFFQQNIKAHPNSFNVYDSMGEAYMVNGQKDLAIENYEKSIAINPDNINGKAILKKLKGE